LRGGAVW